MKGKIIVVTHKEYRMPLDDVYQPMVVGGANLCEKLPNSLTDDSGENIAQKNTNYCELTGLYWLWKNMSELDYAGLVHYRRHFMSVNKKSSDRFDNIMTATEIEQLLETADAILPKKRNYFIETTRSQYEHAHYKKDLDALEGVVSELYPEYSDTFSWAMDQKKSHRFNMMIMKKQYFDEYCEWLFNILFELEQRLDISDYNAYQARIYGFLSERLLDVWVQYNQLNYTEAEVKFMEKQSWVKKGYNFLKRKVVGS